MKSGGFTAHNTVGAPAVDPFEPEKLTAFEIGVKSDLARQLRVDTAVFYYRYKGQQILGKVFDELSQSYIGRFVNADSRIGGGELELEWHPLTGLTISQYAGFAQGYYTNTLLDSSGNNYDGSPESFPKWSYGGDAAYAWHAGGYRLTAESNYSFHDMTPLRATEKELGFTFACHALQALPKIARGNIVHNRTPERILPVRY